jgi:hypothetical protein
LKDASKIEASTQDASQVDVSALLPTQSPSLKDALAIEALPQIDSNALSAEDFPEDPFLHDPPVGDGETLYDKALSEAKQIRKRIKGHQLRLGALADQVEQEYGTDKLGQFAADIGINRDTLERYRSVYRAWRNSGGAAGISFAVLSGLASHPDKAAIVAAKPNMTMREARGIAQAHRQRQQRDWTVKETERWFNDLVERAREDIADESAIDNVPAVTLMKAIEPTLLDTIADGAAARERLVNYLRGLFKEETAGDEDKETADQDA